MAAFSREESTQVISLATLENWMYFSQVKTVISVSSEYKLTFNATNRIVLNLSHDFVPSLFHSSRFFSNGMTSKSWEIDSVRYIQHCMVKLIFDLS